MRDTSSLRRRIVEDARGRSSRLLRLYVFMFGKRSDERARNQVHQKMERFISSNTGKIDGEKIQFIFHILLRRKRTRSRARSINGFHQVKEKMDKVLLKTLVSSSSLQRNDEQNSAFL